MLDWLFGYRAQLAQKDYENGRLRQRVLDLQVQAEADAKFIADLSEEIGNVRSKFAGLRNTLDVRDADAETLQGRADEAVKAANALQKQKDEAERLAGLAYQQMEIYQNAVKMLVERGAISKIEVAQLNLGTFIPAEGDLPATIEFGRVAEGKSSIDFGMKAQATEAKYRQTKQHFVAYQAAVKIILDRLNGLGQKNAVTKEDIRKLREVRDTLSAQIQRTI